MPALIAWFFGVLETRIGSIIVSALLSMGLSFTTYTFAVAPFRELIRSQLSYAPSQMIAILGFLGVDQCITMLLSAITVRWTMRGLSNLVRSKPAAA
ncbi:DUF2523 family protein [Dyella sp.]|uniref:DUF2523 family protein n=1 Tax=Dyella sp. TaxID=1869338 RepID=UPI003F81933F